MAIYYISTDGIDDTDGSRGSLATPYASLLYASNQRGGSNTYIFLPGTYPPQQILKTSSGVDGDRTYIISSKKWQSIIEGDGITANHDCGILLGVYDGVTGLGDGVHYVTIDGFQLTNNGYSGVFVQGSNCIVRNCWSHHNGNGGADPVRHSAGSGFNCNKYTTFHWSNNLWEYNIAEYNGSSGYDHGFYCDGGEFIFRYNIARYNEGCGIQSRVINGTTIQGNLLNDNATYGIYLEDYGLSIVPDVDHPCELNLLYNTIYQNNTDLTANGNAITIAGQPKQWDNTPGRSFTTSVRVVGNITHKGSNTESIYGSIILSPCNNNNGIAPFAAVAWPADTLVGYNLVSTSRNVTCTGIYPLSDETNDTPEFVENYYSSPLGSIDYFPSAASPARSIGLLADRPSSQIDGATRKDDPPDLGAFSYSDTFGTDYFSSKKFVDAKALWESETRTYSGNLPRVCFWVLDVDTTAEQKKELMDTNFYDVHVAAASDSYFDADVGYITMADYLRQYSNLKLYVRGARNWAVVNNSSDPQPVDCYNVDGSHFESACVGATRHSPNLTYQSDTADRYVFLDAGGNPLAVALGDYRFVVPFIPETRQFWTDCEEYFWDYEPTNPIYKLYAQHIVDRLTLEGLTPTGIIVNWEDYFSSYQGAPLPWKTYYDNDPRFNESDPTILATRLVSKNTGETTSARLDTISDQAAWIVAEYANFYDGSTQELPYYTWGKLQTAYDRRKITISFYDHYSINEGPLDLLYYLGYVMSYAAYFNVHLFNMWYCTSLALDLADDNKDPTGDADTVGLSVAFCKAGMAMGAYSLTCYLENYSANHSYYSTIVAYDEMQQYHEYIKYGENYLPPFGVYRPNKDRLEGAAMDTAKPEVPNLWYGYDSDGVAIDENVWICCRTYNDSFMFYGMTVDGTDVSVTVTSPANRPVTVTASGMGSVTLV